MPIDTICYSLNFSISGVVVVVFFFFFNFPILFCLFFLDPYISNFFPSLSKLTITTLFNLNCKRIRTHSPTTLLSAMTSSSSLLPSTTAVVPIANVETRPTKNKQYLCLFSVITAGLLDEDIGSDEQEIIEIVNVIIDVDQKQVRWILLRIRSFKLNVY